MMDNSGAVDPNSGEERTPQLTPSTLRFVSLFFLVVAAVFMAFILVTAESRDPYASGINLSNLEANEFVVVNQLPEVTISNIKIRHMLNAPVPLASVYGPHTVAGFAAADADMKTGEFFNFASHWAGLPDTKALLSYLKASKKLPTRTIYVGLPHPHTGTFSHLTLPMEELPPSVYLLHSGAWVGTNIRRSMRLYGGQIRDRLDWRNLAYVMTDVCRPKYGIISAANSARTADTLANPNGFFALLASGIAGKAIAQECPTLWGIDRDGRDHRWLSPPIGTPRRLGPKAATNVFTGGMHTVISMMKEIDAHATADRQVVFFSHPLYETAHASASFDTMTKIIAAAQKQGMIVFDDRRGSYDHTYYINSTHPNGKYFSELVRKTTALR